MALAGLVWLAVLFAIAWLQLPPPPTPQLGRVPVPDAVAARRGACSGLLVAADQRVCGGSAGWRRAGRAGAGCEERVERVADEAVVGPVERELAAHTALCGAIARLS